MAEKLCFKYETNGDIKEIETTYTDGSKSIQKRIRHGNALYIKTFDEDNITEGEEVHEFDSKGNILKRVVFDEGKIIQQKFNYEYNDRGQIKTITEYGTNEEFVVKKVFEYNQKRLPTKELHYSERDKLFNAIISEYNDHGDLIMQRRDGNLLTQISYDDKMRKIKEETVNLSTDTTLAFKIYVYNDSDLLTKTISYEMGQEYQMEPGVLARSSSQSVNTKFQYEFYEE